MSSRNRSLQGSCGGPGGTFMATTLCFKSGVLNQGQLCPQETLARDLFGHYWGQGCYWYLVGRGQTCCQAFYMHRACKEWYGTKPQ